MKRAVYEIFQGGSPTNIPAEWYWRLRAANGEPLCHSESYTRKEDAERGAKDARKASRFASIET
jgi:uncharacterized protein YegP (UPF0339 family)